ncbi:hypothetical protein B0H10DRAFT_2215508 [Mycena sp. CBHHK59/15]|nr:hypothetical protein B0H10DRAFT_2215508 [Mycena sp. CBHHK59/15]
MNCSSTGSNIGIRNATCQLAVEPDPPARDVNANPNCLMWTASHLGLWMAHPTLKPRLWFALAGLMPPGSCYHGNGHDGLNPGGKYEMHAKPTLNHVLPLGRLQDSTHAVEVTVHVCLTMGPAAFTVCGEVPSTSTVVGDESEVDVNANVNTNADADVELENAVRWELL